MANKLMIIDDEQSILDLLEGVFADGGFDVQLERDGESALGHGSIGPMLRWST
jgi:DNA-binding NtrC family response regulator